MIFDPIYLMFIAPGLALSLWASWRVKSNFNKYSKVRSTRGITGAEAAAELLRTASIDEVKIVRTSGKLSDHYNPINKTLALSESVYDSSSIAAIGVATHEAGHAIQHAKHYGPLWVRSLLVCFNMACSCPSCANTAIACVFASTWLTRGCGRSAA